MKIAVLITCFNRAQITVGCLRHLIISFRLLVCEGKHVVADIWFNEDACSDNTVELVEDWHRSLSNMDFDVSLHLIHGSGHDYWCGGMRRAWQAAIDSGIDYDGYLWLNDDTYLLPNAFETLFSAPDTANAILVGAISSRDGRRATYGGEDSHGFVKPNGSWQPIRQMNGNVVWIPRTVFKRLGNLDRHWTHAMGDGDYSRTAVECGIPVFLSPQFVGTCEREARLVPWCDPSVSLVKRIKNLYSPLGYSEPYNIFRYCLRHDGLRVAVKNWLSCHWIALFPKKEAVCAS